MVSTARFRTTKWLCLVLLTLTLVANFAASQQNTMASAEAFLPETGVQDFEFRQPADSCRSCKDSTLNGDSSCTTMPVLNEINFYLFGDAGGEGTLLWNFDEEAWIGQVDISNNCSGTIMEVRVELESLPTNKVKGTISVGSATDSATGLCGCNPFQGTIPQTVPGQTIDEATLQLSAPGTCYDNIEVVIDFWE